MNYNTIFMSMLVMACHRAPVFEAKTQLFVQRDGNTNFNGVASMLLTDGDVDCSRFEDGLEDNDMPDTLEDMTGVLIRLAYAFAASRGRAASRPTATSRGSRTPAMTKRARQRPSGSTPRASG